MNRLCLILFLLLAGTATAAEPQPRDCLYLLTQPGCAVCPKEAAALARMNADGRLSKVCFRVLDYDKDKDDVKALLGDVWPATPCLLRWRCDAVLPGCYGESDIQAWLLTGHSPPAEAPSPVVSTANHGSLCESAEEQEPEGHEGRSPEWPAFRKHWLASHPTCAACGTTKGVQAHHVHPVHEFPEDELKLVVDGKPNLCTLCPRCHLIFGHLGDFRARYNLCVIEDAARHLAEIKDAPKGRSGMRLFELKFETDP